MLNSDSPRFAVSNPGMIKSARDDLLFGRAALAAPKHAQNKARLKPHVQIYWIMMLFKSTTPRFAAPNPRITLFYREVRKGVQRKPCLDFVFPLRSFASSAVKDLDSVIQESTTA